MFNFSYDIIHVQGNINFLLIQLVCQDALMIFLCFSETAHNNKHIYKEQQQQDYLELNHEEVLLL